MKSIYRSTSMIDDKINTTPLIIVGKRRSQTVSEGRIS